MGNEGRPPQLIGCHSLICMSVGQAVCETGARLRSFLVRGGRETLSRKRLDANSLRRVGPEEVAGLGLRTSVEKTAARKIAPKKRWLDEVLYRSSVPSDASQQQLSYQEKDRPLHGLAGPA